MSKPAVNAKNFIVKPNGKKIISLRDFRTTWRDFPPKIDIKDLIEDNKKELKDMKDKLYASKKYSVLIVIQGMDTSGKDGIVEHVFSGFTPVGVRAHSYKTPSSLELSHNFLWRHDRDLPPHGDIALFIRSHYENVIYTKVHPSFIVEKERPPNIESIKDINAPFWKKRYKEINRWEKTLHESGTIIIKFYLHLSKVEQSARLLSRIQKKHKRWKFSINDVYERKYWKQYQEAYEMALSKTSKSYAPWFIIPADDKPYARLAVGTIICEQFAKLGLAYPKPDKMLEGDLEKAEKILITS